VRSTLEKVLTKYPEYVIKLRVAVLTRSGTLLHVCLNSTLFMRLELGGH